MCFLNQKGGLSSARAAQANKQKEWNGFCQWKDGGCWEITRQQNENHYQSRPSPKEGEPLKPQTG